MTVRRPASAPCVSCPYRLDVPSEEEYAKLPSYDGTTGEQAMNGAHGVFLCHQQDGRVCAGWAGCHDMDESLGLRLAAQAGTIDRAELEATLWYETPTPLFASGREAAEHGLAEISAPPAAAVRAIRRLDRGRRE